jgi:hypothetical protein
MAPTFGRRRRRWPSASFTIPVVRAPMDIQRVAKSATETANGMDRQGEYAATSGLCLYVEKVGLTRVRSFEIILPNHRLAGGWLCVFLLAYRHSYIFRFKKCFIL